MEWLEVHIDTNHAGLEPLEIFLSANGVDGVVIDDEQDFQSFLENNHQYWDYVDEDLEASMKGKSRITFYLPADGDGFDQLAHLRTALQGFKDAHAGKYGTLLMTLENLKDADWENNWKQYYKPMEIGERLLVIPEWEQENVKGQAKYAGKVPLILEPGLTFGTGSHATTRLCLTALEEAVHGGETVLDLGCGSGILSIAALRLGAASAKAVDIDDKCLTVAYENAALNGIGKDRYAVLVGDVLSNGALRETLGGGYDVVVANIVADVIIGLAPMVRQFLKPGGLFLCSGIIDTRAGEDKLQALNTWMTPKMPLLILGALALGLLFPDQIGLLCPAVSALMMFQTFANSLGSSVQDLGRVLSHPKPVLITMLSLHLLMPLAALGIGSMCFPDQPLYTLSLVLMEGSPAAVSSLMWIVIGGGSVELCLSIILLDTMLSPVILPLTLRLLCGSVVELDTFGMIRDLFVMIVVPAALAMVLCRLLGQSICAKAKQRLSPFSKLALLVIICANVTRCAPFLHELNRELVLLLCITLAMRLIGLGLGFLLSTLFRFPYPVELTVTVNSSMRNNAAAATLAAQYFPSEVVFSPSVSPLFSQLTSSLAVRALQKRQQKIDHPAS